MPKKIILPYVGTCNDNSCHALRLYYGLYTQCANKRYKKTEYCKVCLKHVEASENQRPPYGTIQDRLKTGILDYVDPKGKKTVPYYKVLSKLKVTKEEALAEAARQNISIPDIHWGEVVESTSGRPKKEIIICDENDLIDDAIKEQTEQPLTCKLFEYEHKTYLKTEDDYLYDIDTEELIGKYDVERGII